jgi:hypothetical protein
MISSQQAAEALKEAAIAEKRSRAAYSYSLSAPYFFVWGIVWLLGYGAEALVPLAHLPRNLIGWSWTGLSLAGVAACIIVGRKQALRNGRSAWRAAALFLIIWLYFFASFSVLPPHSEQQAGAYIPLLFAAIYAAIGLWLGLRYILVGVFVAVATLGPTSSCANISSFGWR